MTNTLQVDATANEAETITGEIWETAPSAEIMLQMLPEHLEHDFCGWGGFPDFACDGFGFIRSSVNLEGVCHRLVQDLVSPTCWLSSGSRGAFGLVSDRREMDFREWFESVAGVVATFQFLLEAYER